MLLLANWFACSVRCQFERTGLFHGTGQVETTVRKATGGFDGPESDMCGWMTNGGLELPDTSVPVPYFSPTPLVAFQDSPFSELSALAREPRVHSEWSLAPPELRASFHFIFRNALPARAPSLA